MGVKFEDFRRSLKHKIHHTLRLERALRLVWQSGPGWTIASLMLLIVQGLLPLLSLYFMKLVVDAVAIGLTNNNKEEAFRRVVFFVGFAGMATLISILCNSLAGLVSTAQTQAVTDYMQGILQAKSLEVDLEYYENSQYHDTLQRAQQEAPYRPTRIVNGLVQIGQNGISLLAIAGLLLSFHWGIAVILFLAAIPGVLVRLKYADQMYRWQRQRTSIERKTWYFNWMLTGDAHAKEMRLFALGSLFSRQFRHLRQKLYRENLAIATRRSVADAIAQTSAGLFVFGAYAFIAYRTLHGILTLGDLVMFSQAFQRGRGALQGVLGGFAGLYEDNLFLSNLYEFLDLKPKLLEPLHPKPIPRPMRTGIVFDRVSFQYSSTSRQALKDVTLTIRPGEVVALVGENGSGKTTLIKLLCRLYDPTQGSIAFDGIDLRQFNTAAWRREISVIFQDYAKYHLTARENIWFGNIDLPPDDKQIVTAARYAGADQVITSLPHGYETILGKWFEDGEELSIGQWQKIALARAFLRDAQIIVLDEPTSALDALAEHEVFKQFRQLVKGRTAILISHRLSTVKMADCIYVLENGRIVESGTHDQLVRREGTYAHLFETQAQYYR
jgi:ATP-binding cassette, subfamily B, bacterial